MKYFLFALSLFAATEAHAQSFGQQMVDQVNREQSAYYPEPVVEPVIPMATTMDGTTYWTQNGPVVDRGEGVVSCRALGGFSPSLISKTWLVPL